MGLCSSVKLSLNADGQVSLKMSNELLATAYENRHQYNRQEQCLIKKEVACRLKTMLPLEQPILARQTGYIKDLPQE